MPVNAVGRHSALGVASEHACQIHCTGTFGAVKPPYGLRNLGIKIHRFSAVAPAGSDGKRNANIIVAEFVGAHGRFKTPADSGVGNDALDGRTVGILKIAGNQLGGRLCHLHRLVF